MDFPPGQSGRCRHAELPFHVLRRIKEHASRGLPVPPRAACLLHVVLQRTGNVRVDHQAHVRFVDAHSEGIGGRNHPQLAADESLLHALLRFRGQARVKVFRGHVLKLQELRRLFGLASRRAIDDGASRGIRRQIRHQYLMDVREFLRFGRLHDDEIQIRALGPAVEHA